MYPRPAANLCGRLALARANRASSPTSPRSRDRCPAPLPPGYRIRAHRRPELRRIGLEPIASRSDPPRARLGPDIRQHSRCRASGSPLGLISTRTRPGRVSPPAHGPRSARARPDGTGPAPTMGTAPDPAYPRRRRGARRRDIEAHPPRIGPKPLAPCPRATRPVSVARSFALGKSRPNRRSTEVDRSHHGGDLRHFAKQIQPSSSRPANRPSRGRFRRWNRSAITASDARTNPSCWVVSRSKVHRCIPFGLKPEPFRMPGSQPNRSRIRSARRVARSSAVSRWQA
jgi:hypothetical protein